MHRINTVVLFSLIILTGLIQAASSCYIELLGARPDLLLVVVIFSALFVPLDSAWKAAVLAGLFKDITSSSVFGGHIVSFLSIAILLNYNQRKFFKDRILTQVFMGCCAHLLTDGLVILFNLISYRSWVYYQVEWASLFGSSIYTGLIMPPAFFLLPYLLRVKITPA